MKVARPYRFFWPAADDTALDVLRASRGLTEANGAERSHGRVTAVEGYSRRTGKPARNGLYCARIFGPTEDHSCLCGKFRGASHDGVVCDTCGVVCGRAEARQRLFGHLESPVGLLHPRLRATVAEVLAWSEDAVLGVLLGTWELRGGEPAPISDDWRDDADDDEPRTFERCGSAVLHERLREAEHEAWQSRLAAEGYTLADLLITHIPVLPAAEREPRVVTSPDFGD
ncbi:MAG: hypothetical protein KC609_25440, partial [Myxococcales bacterium]|nr:hypothetical protein [Myxococcales bacterium]